jgi:hypothetical protein
LAGNNSDITNNGIGPHPKENPIIYTMNFQLYWLVLYKL